MNGPVDLAAPPAYRLDDHVGYILRRASQRHAALFQDEAPEGLTPTQFAAIVRLDEKGPCSQNQLGRLTSMDVATIKGVVARLFAKGFVTITPDTGDRRRTIIALSDEGREIVGRLHDAGHRITEATLAPLNRRERETFLRLLLKLT